MKIAFVFPGQGSQYVGMGKDLFDNFVPARQAFEEASDILGFDIRRMCFEGPEEELKKTSNTQPAILLVSVCCSLALKENGIIPSAVAGHSLGEYSALVAAESMKLSDALRLVQKRGSFMQECAPAGGGMAAVLGLERDLVEKACREATSEGVVEVANYNCPGQIVIAGEEKGLAKAIELARVYGAKKAIVLQVGGPFHSSLMTNAAKRLAEELKYVAMSNPVYPLISNVTAKPVSDDKEIRELLTKQVSSSVRWEESVARLGSMGINTFVEAGPGKVLTGLGKKIIKEAVLLNVQDMASLQNTLDNLKEVI